MGYNRRSLDIAMAKIGPLPYFKRPEISNWHPRYCDVDILGKNVIESHLLNTTDHRIQAIGLWKCCIHFYCHNFFQIIIIFMLSIFYYNHGASKIFLSLSDYLLFHLASLENIFCLEEKYRFAQKIINTFPSIEQEIHRNSL